MYSGLIQQLNASSSAKYGRDRDNDDHRAGQRGGPAALAAYPDLELVGRLIVVKPVHHILRGIYIDRSLDPQLFAFRIIGEEGSLIARMAFGTLSIRPRHR